MSCEISGSRGPARKYTAFDKGGLAVPVSRGSIHVLMQVLSCWSRPSASPLDFHRDALSPAQHIVCSPWMLLAGRERDQSVFFFQNSQLISSHGKWSKSMRQVGWHSCFVALHNSSRRRISWRSAVAGYISVFAFERA